MEIGHVQLGIPTMNDLPRNTRISVARLVCAAGVSVAIAMIRQKPGTVFDLFHPKSVFNKQNHGDSK